MNGFGSRWFSSQSNIGDEIRDVPSVSIRSSRIMVIRGEPCPINRWCDQPDRLILRCHLPISAVRASRASAGNVGRVASNLSALVGTPCR